LSSGSGQVAFGTTRPAFRVGQQQHQQQQHQPNLAQAFESNQPTQTFGTQSFGSSQTHKQAPRTSQPTFGTNQLVFRTNQLPPIPLMPTTYEEFLQALSATWKLGQAQGQNQAQAQTQNQNQIKSRN